MYDAIGEPCHDAEEGTGMCGEDVAEIGTVEDILQSRKNTDPDGWSPTAWDETTTR